MEEKIYKDEDNSEIYNPSHYTSHPSGVSCIEITRWCTFNIGNVIKYCWRHGLKGVKENEDKAAFLKAAIKDLKKASVYLNDEIMRLEKMLKEC